MIETIDTHTLGEPTRIVVDGFPTLRGRTLKARSQDLLQRHDDLRRALMWEPRGHPIMFGAVVVPPADLRADLGLVFMDGGGAVEMCVHGTMGAVTALVETKRLSLSRGGSLVIETPAGLVRASLKRTRNRVTAVELEGVPARTVASGLRIRIKDQDVPYDLAYAGNLIAVVNGNEVGVSVTRSSFRALVDFGMAVKREAQREWRASKVRPGPWDEIVSVLLYAALGRRRYRDLVVFRNNSVDRSPCGSCFAGLMALLYTKGELRLGRWIVCENLLELAFRGRLIERENELIPQLSGRAFITGEHRFRIDPTDPLCHGFQLE